MASPDTIILLIVDYYAAIAGGKDPRATPPPLRTPLGGLPFEFWFLCLAVPPLRKFTAPPGDWPNDVRVHLLGVALKHLSEDPG